MFSNELMSDLFLGFLFLTIVVFTVTMSIVETVSILSFVVMFAVVTYIAFTTTKKLFKTS
jgi:hypothetical protein